MGAANEAVAEALELALELRPEAFEDAVYVGPLGRREVAGLAAGGVGDEGEKGSGEPVLTTAEDGVEAVEEGRGVGRGEGRHVAGIFVRAAGQSTASPLHTSIRAGVTGFGVAAGAALVAARTPTRWPPIWAAGRRRDSCNCCR